MTGSATYLEHYLEPIRSFLDRETVTDVYVNRPGEVWVESLGGEVAREDVPSLTEAHLWRLAHQVAAQSHQGVSRRHPLLAATIEGGVRAQFVAAPATRGAMAIAFRRHLAKSANIADYDDPKTHANRCRNADEKGRFPLENASNAFILDWAVRARKNIVISGGTSSGKTTLLNSLMRSIPSEERLIAIEDTPELRLHHHNSLGLIAVRGGEGEASVSTLQLLEAALRMRPDRILLGELRGPEAFTFLRAINTGHPGSITTLHADSPAGAIRQLAMMALQAELGISYADLMPMISNMVDVVVQMARRDGRRVIADIVLRPDEVFKGSLSEFENSLPLSAVGGGSVGTP